MIMRREVRDAAVLEELYQNKENEDELWANSGSETDDVIEYESSHASETDADEDDKDDESGQRKEQAPKHLASQHVNANGASQLTCAPKVNTNGLFLLRSREAGDHKLSMYLLLKVML